MIHVQSALRFEFAAAVLMADDDDGRKRAGCAYEYSPMMGVASSILAYWNGIPRVYRGFASRGQQFHQERFHLLVLAADAVGCVGSSTVMYWLCMQLQVL